MNINIEDKFEKLKKIILECESAVVAFSGGVDSTFLLKIAHEVLGSKILAVTALSAVQIVDEMEETKELAADIGVEHLFIRTNEMESEDYVSNPENRCYFCKHILYDDVIKVASEHGFNFVLDGTNFDDLSDYRPGLKALDELKVLSPLKEAGLTKSDIRILSKRMGLRTSSKPAMACLSSRIPYGTRITDEKLRRIDAAETFLRAEGFAQVRVRDHGTIARIEVDTEQLGRMFAGDTHRRISEKLKSLGYTYVTLDIDGYKMGSLNRLVAGNGSR